MMPISTGTGLERVGVAGLDLNVLGLGCRLRTWRSSAKNKKEGGSARASPVAALMLKSVPR